MRSTLAAFLILIATTGKTGAQKNWAPVPCFDGKYQITKMMLDSLHDEIILNFFADHTICNKEFKGILAFNGTDFHNLDYGFDLHNPNKAGPRISGCITYESKTLFAGIFASAGTNTIQSEAMALWNGMGWEAFPKFAFNYNPNRVSPVAGVREFLKYKGKLWICGQFENLGGVTGTNLYSFDGDNFVHHALPVSDNYTVHKMIRYKNDLIVAGNFFNYPSWSMARIAKYDGFNWSPVGNGVSGSFDGIGDMIVYKDTLYIGGAFSKGNGNLGNYIMKWDGSQLYDAGFGGFYDWGAIRQLLVYKDRLYAFGNFTHAADKKAFGVAYYEGGKWTVPTDSIDNTITSAVVYKDEIYIAGGFQSINGDTTLKYFAKLRCPDFDYTCVNGTIENAKDLKNIRVFPNPFNDRFTIELPGENYFINASFSFSDNIGRELYSGTIYRSTHDIKLPSLSPGVYHLKINTGGKEIHHKLLKTD